MKITLDHIEQAFGDPPTYVLRGINTTIERGEFVSLIGRSGSGKSTLLYILGTLDRPWKGRVLFDEEDANLWSTEKIHTFRNENLGFVFQFHYLIPELTAIENILLPTLKRNLGSEYRARALELLSEFGLEDKADRHPSALSGGEQQRVAIARALILKPKILLADEPTGNLDSENGEIVMKLFERINREESTSIILVTHDPGYAARAKRQIHLKDGKIVD